MEQTKSNIALANGRLFDSSLVRSSRRRILALGGSALLGAGIGQVGPATAMPTCDQQGHSYESYLIGFWVSQLRARIVSYAKSQVGRCVSDNKGTSQPGVCGPAAGVGKGECTHLVHSAVVLSGGSPPDYSHPPHYTWGLRDTPGPGDRYLPGEIIQLVNARFDGPNGGWWETSTQHTAIIESVQGTVLHLLQQHSPERIVTRGTLDLGWRLSRGDFAVFYAWPNFLRNC
jgi:hypothetical protein